MLFDFPFFSRLVLISTTGLHIWPMHPFTYEIVHGMQSLHFPVPEAISLKYFPQNCIYNDAEMIPWESIHDWLFNLCKIELRGPPVPIPPLLRANREN